MGNPADDELKKAATNLLGEDKNEDFFPLTLRRSDPANPKSPWLVLLCVTQQAPSRGWENTIKDCGEPTEEMLEKINETWEKIVKNPELKGQVVFDFTDKPENADIIYMRARSTIPYDSPEGWSGKTKGFVDDRTGRLHKEILLNMDNPCWTDPDRKKPPDPLPTLKERSEEATSVTDHETAHAMGLRHWKRDGREPTLAETRDEKAPTTDQTVVANKLGILPSDFRPVDWVALAYHYVMQNRTIKSSMVHVTETKEKVAVFEEGDNVAVTASDAAGYTVFNKGGGNIIVKLTKTQFGRAMIDANVTKEGNTIYTLTFDGDPTHEIKLDSNAKIAMMKEDGQGGLEKMTSITKAQLAAALEKGPATPLLAENDSPAPPSLFLGRNGAWRA